MALKRQQSTLSPHSQGSDMEQLDSHHVNIDWKLVLNVHFYIGSVLINIICFPDYVEHNILASQCEGSNYLENNLIIFIIYFYNMVQYPSWKIFLHYETLLWV